MVSETESSKISNSSLKLKARLLIIARGLVIGDL